VVVFSSAKKAPRCIDRKWLMYRCQFNFSATMVNPDACCRSKPVGETRFPVARKFVIFEPISKFTRLRTLLKYRSTGCVIGFREGGWVRLLTVKEIRLSFLNVGGDLGSDLVQGLLQSFLDNHPVERTRE